MADRTGSIADNLDLDVSGPIKETFGVDPRVAKGLAGFRARPFQSGFQVLLVSDNSNAAPTATRQCLQNQGLIVAEFVEKIAG